MKRLFLLTFCLLGVCGTVNSQPVDRRAKYDIKKGPVLYTVGYAHLDSQWNWDYVTTIDEYLLATLEKNFELMDKYPDYVFSFTGSRRYRLMKEYYPDLYARMLEYMKQGRWYATGSCVDEGEVNVSSSEALMRQILYGNIYYEKEFGAASVDYMLPDCFGFVTTMPSVLAHAGLKGFSTQKLTWRAARPIPFNVGVWNGPDGKGVIAALNATKYSGKVVKRLDRDSMWVARIAENKRLYGLNFDYRYYGVGDIGGAPRQNDIKNVVNSLPTKDSKIQVVLTSSDQMYRDISPAMRAKMPTYCGDLLLVEHSAGSTTSQSFMKRSNRKNELLAKAAEQASVVADWIGAAQYPFEKINNSWDLILGSQFHDILPGTSIPKAYEYSWNDEFIAMNGLSSAMKNAVGGISAAMNTDVSSRAVVVYNPVAAARTDVVSGTMEFAADTRSVVVKDSRGVTLPSQVVAQRGNKFDFIFLASIPSMGVGVFDVIPSLQEPSTNVALSVSGRVLNNDSYRVTIAENGDIASVYDKKQSRELLAKPASLEFLTESPEQWPAWNMDWKDRQKAPKSKMDQNVSIRVVENGPVRVAIEVSRQGENSKIVQKISLAAADPGRVVVVDNRIDWQSKGVSLKAAFPLTASNPEATYSLNNATISRGNNHSNEFEVPSREWFDLTDKTGAHGVSVLEDCRYGSDKPDDNTLRLTLMYTPIANVNKYSYQQTQDWGVHDVRYGIYSHEGRWTNGTPWQAKFMNQPLVAFETEKHGGALGGEFSLIEASSAQIDVMAFKKMERDSYYIVRLNELSGESVKGATVGFFAPVTEAYEVDGQEHKIGAAVVKGGKLVVDMTKYAMRTFAVRFASADKAMVVAALRQQPVVLPYNVDIVSTNDNRTDGSIGDSGLSFPAEMFNAGEVVSEDVRFAINGLESGAKNAIECLGQKVALPAGDYNKVYLLAVAQDDAQGVFTVDGVATNLGIQKWNGYIGQHYTQVVVPDSARYKTLAIENPFVKRDNIAAFSTHYHAPKGNCAYQFCHLYKYEINIEKGARELVLPNNPYIKVVAVTVAQNSADDVAELQPLYDNFDGYPMFHLRK